MCGGFGHGSIDPNVVPTFPLFSSSNLFLSAISSSTSKLFWSPTNFNVGLGVCKNPGREYSPSIVAYRDHKRMVGTWNGGWVHSKFGQPHQLMQIAQRSMKHQLLSNGGASVSVPAQPTRASKAAAAVAPPNPPAKARPAAATRPVVRASSNCKEEKKSELPAEAEALRREVERLRRRNAELEKQLALAHHTVAQLRQQQAAADKDSVALPTSTCIARAAPPPPPPPPPPPCSSRGVPAPPPPPLSRSRGVPALPSRPQGPSKATALVDMYNSLSTKTGSSAASSIVGELQNRSKHLL
ncbi:hypothetical protein GUJ93_ZPchr0009g2066, partial [Zizania palustris]